DIELSVSLASELDRVRIDPRQVEQILMNLSVNARDAMPHGGRVTIETANATIDEHFAQFTPGVVPGRYVLLAVTDSGMGMDEGTRSRIFEPFFTTKDPGKGTGLGLSMVYGMVTQSGGHIQVDSESGRGSRFTVYLPAAVPSATPAPPGPRSAGALHGTETVLLVEDEQTIRGL